MRNKTFREFYRKDLAARAKLYTTLATQRPPESDQAQYFTSLAKLHQEELKQFGPEPPPKPRGSREEGKSVAVVYPDLPPSLTHRVHFLESGSLRRERAAALAIYGDAVVRQAAPNGDILLSIAVKPTRAQFFERLIEALRSPGLSTKAGGFTGYLDASGALVDGPNWDDLASPWRRIADDNFRARLYHWDAHQGQLDPLIVLPNDSPPIPDSLPWDPDPRFHKILALTQEDRLVEAMERMEAIPAAEREILFDEAIYLRYLLGQAPRGDDLRYLARRYIAGSAIKSRLEEEFDAFINCLDITLSGSGPILDTFPGLSGISEVLRDDLDPMMRDTPPLKDWAATRRYYYRQLKVYGHPVRPRGRVFVWNPDLASYSLSQVLRTFEPDLAAAENAFRRARSIAEIGRGWASETALYDLIQSLRPDAVHQWRPSFLGLQSVDIYVPSMNLAIEYQGEQHYRPVEIFGGQEGLAATQARDARKHGLLRANGVTLIEWPYDRPIKGAEVEAMLALLRPVVDGSAGI